MARGWPRLPVLAEGTAAGRRAQRAFTEENMATNEDNGTARSEVKRRVIEAAAHAFQTKGIKDVTMDELARSLTMSKRTLYQLFADKEELLLECMAYHAEHERSQMAQALADTDNVINFILYVFERRMREAEDLPPQFLPELKKYPRVLRFLRERHDAQVEQGVAFLQRGKEQGLLRPEIDLRIVLEAIGALIEFSLSDAMLSAYTPARLSMNTLFVYLRGCTTPAGARLMDDYLAARATR